MHVCIHYNNSTYYYYYLLLLFENKTGQAITAVPAREQQRERGRPPTAARCAGWAAA